MVYSRQETINMSVRIKYSLISLVFIVAVITFIYTSVPARNNLVVEASEIGDVHYSFFVAGHTYGRPGINNSGLHPPFRKQLENIRSYRGMNLGILTGDVVWTSTKNDWDEVDKDLDSLKFPVFIAPGNHDVANRKLFVKRYGSNDKGYQSFSHKGDLFIILDPNEDNWNIRGAQLIFLRKTLEHSKQYRNIFVFFHQMLWWDGANKYKKVKINSTQGRSASINFWPTLVPVFVSLNRPVYMFAGDVGAFPGHLPLYDNFKNLHFFASGMGGGQHDNFIIVSVPPAPDARIGIKTIWLNKSHSEKKSILDYTP